MKRIILIISTLLIFAFFNFGIYQKEKIKLNGETVFLKLAPVDPRSLIQGDYMQLGYAIAQDHSQLPTKERGYIVLGLGENKVATFKRFYEGESLAPDEKLIHYQIQNGRIQIVPDSFMFQEGQAKFFRIAEYGVFKFDSPRKYILVGLADESLQIIMRR